MSNIPCEWIPGHVVVGADDSAWAVVHCLDVVDPQQRSFGSLHDQTQRTARIQVVTKWLHTQGWLAIPMPVASDVAVYLPSERDLTLLLLSLNLPRVEYRKTIHGQFTVYTEHSIFGSLVSNGLIKPPTGKRARRKQLFAAKIDRLKKAL